MSPKYIMMMPTMSLARRMRSDAPTGEPLHQSLRKTLKQVQTIHATTATDLGKVASRPIVRMRNAPLSSIGGLRRDVIEPFKSRQQKVMKISHHDAKLMMLTNNQQARKVFPSNTAKAGI